MYIHMDTFITIAVFVVFGYIVIKKKLLPAYQKKKEKENDSENLTLADDTRKKRTYYEVLVFSESEAENSVFFRERIDLHLTRAVGEIAERGYNPNVQFITLNSTLIVVLSYEI